jgi:hypothetical protein
LDVFERILPEEIGATCFFLLVHPSNRWTNWMYIVECNGDLTNDRFDRTTTFPVVVVDDAKEREFGMDSGDLYNELAP